MHTGCHIMMTSSHLHWSNPDVLAGLCALINAPTSPSIYLRQRVSQPILASSLCPGALLFIATSKRHISHRSQWQRHTELPFSGAHNLRNWGVSNQVVRIPFWVPAGWKEACSEGSVKDCPRTYSSLWLKFTFRQQQTSKHDWFFRISTMNQPSSWMQQHAVLGQFLSWWIVSNLSKYNMLSVLIFWKRLRCDQHTVVEFFVFLVWVKGGPWILADKKSWCLISREEHVYSGWVRFWRSCSQSIRSVLSHRINKSIGWINMTTQSAHA